MNPTVVMKYVGNMHKRKCDIIDQMLNGHRLLTNEEQTELDWIHEKIVITGNLIAGGWYEHEKQTN
ncbi:hypothetical protein [Candidatus Enterococcus mansonii]|uniref:Uncharacterized protein n=1 Tax=Candidatus Enterococcus mansonii TaxID=1834181 RepID=A0A242CI55_9ENTE|nr:hypothetical protein [Enterococcus sp. 4G2_DIV0659]OTO09590.1 hypothetical protein A5880_000269 [Enterococcus sp. 4G2_DIV0659]